MPLDLPLDVALDARGSGRRRRWVRSGRWPNAEVRVFVCYGETGTPRVERTKASKHGVHLVRIPADFLVAYDPPKNVQFRLELLHLAGAQVELLPFKCVNYNFEMLNMVFKGIRIGDNVI
jgi:hypothetical protein